MASLSSAASLAFAPAAASRRSADRLVSLAAGDYSTKVIDALVLSSVCVVN